MKRACLGAAFLTKLAKHLALLPCLMIVSQAAGQPVIGELGIFLTVVLAVLIYSVGRALHYRSFVRLPLCRGPT